MYQFNKTALEILSAQDDDKITVEGIIEDIEVATSTTLKAVQPGRLGCRRKPNVTLREVSVMANAIGKGCVSFVSLTYTEFSLPIDTRLF
ncbi:hypothetical protein [Nitrosomonas sp. sh817]|uniref:hypothetical protein n=1 Tax=Nitrosomonas sp. sh817 TaxID=3070658 RepID=UPI0027DB7C0A|nr:hypothetical protein [Nitrosomonas sp. sh817]